MPKGSAAVETRGSNPKRVPSAKEILKDVGVIFAEKPKSVPRWRRRSIDGLELGHLVNYVYSPGERIDSGV